MPVSYNAGASLSSYKTKDFSIYAFISVGAALSTQSLHIDGAILKSK